MKTKTCSKCRIKKYISEFQKRKDSKDRRRGQCKDCRKETQKKYLKTREGKEVTRKANKKYRNSKKGKKYYKKYPKTEKGKEVLRRYRESEKSKKYRREYYEICRQSDKYKKSIRKSSRKWKENNPLKLQAQRILYNAIRRGDIIRPKVCKVCGKTNCIIYGHHSSYKKGDELKVKWLCYGCHKDLHKELRKKAIRDKRELK